MALRAQCSDVVDRSGFISATYSVSVCGADPGEDSPVSIDPRNDQKLIITI